MKSTEARVYSALGGLCVIVFLCCLATIASGLIAALSPLDMAGGKTAAAWAAIIAVWSVLGALICHMGHPDNNKPAKGN